MAVTDLQRNSVERRVSKKQRPLKGPEKAAILFLCLGEARGSSLMQQLSDEEIQVITRAMAGLGVIDAEKVEQVMLDFTEGVANGGGVVGSFSVAEDMLRSFLPEDQVDSILKDIRGPLKEKDLWARFSSLSENVIANYLKNEHDQTAAAILSNVKTDVAAKVLPLLGQEKMENVVERMIRMEAVPHHMMRQIEETLQTDIISAPAQPTTAELQQKMADLFNKLDMVAFQDLSETLEKRIPDTFGAIKNKMFVFDDLINLNPMDLARVMRGAPGNALPMALRGAKKEIRDHFLNALPGRSRDMLEEEMNTMGPVRGRDVREAQSGLVDYAKELADEEVIRLPLASDDDEEFI
ncbi:flagellar motor switch protein FliG [Pseudooceanicola atlanticus]|jgi:flagellar motor switch protein FliG|uniref:Flagellar motor switch protein FliG n=1 Tax=Pseudooceanicola atlanticus TaxID=1461694 RepID=A0A0A0E958_9RHOB|nr:FliG C-terminal domain-containing protein [Pseudooceanicola atlanticus]KGM46954.1 flagellar motor protein [Pseudooceanicola atlanticus]